jgi:hypothetical protein
MFLVQINKNEFVDAERIDWINISKDKITFTCVGSEDHILMVHGEYMSIFLNNVQALDNNATDIQRYFNEIEGR